MASTIVWADDLGRTDGVDEPAVSVNPRLRVLLVDDDPVSLIRLQDVVRGDGIQIVGTTNDGEHALELARLLDPDLALIDWDMGRFGGALTARLMRRYTPGVAPVLLLDAGDADEAEAARSQLSFWAVSKHSRATELREALWSIARREAARRASRPPSRAQPA